MSEDRKGLSGAGRAGLVLGGSLALNLFLIGALVGPIWGRGPEPARPPVAFHLPPGPGGVFERMAQDLEPGEASKLRAIFAEEREGLDKKHQAMRETMGRLAAVMKEEKPDLETLRKVLAEIHGSGERLHDGMARAMERVATELSLESRRKIAAQIEAGPFAGRRGDRSDGASRGGPGPGHHPRPPEEDSAAGGPPDEPAP